VVWWWRVQLAAPEMRAKVGDLDDVRRTGDEFALGELAKKLLGQPFDVADLEAWLTFKPWADESHRATYWRAVEMGLVMPIQNCTLVLGWRFRKATPRTIGPS